MYTYIYTYVYIYIHIERDRLSFVWGKLPPSALLRDASSTASVGPRADAQEHIYIYI